jgi:GWxTD domain-containing protein
MPHLVRAILAVGLSASLLGSPILAQDNQSQSQAKPKPDKKKMKQVYKELGEAYKHWLDEEVPYIITPSERTAFLQLSTNEEREQFIEQFWLRRSSNPDLPDSDYKEEHYRRIAYANEHFASGVPGWKTDRGRIYIMWGKPDEIESHPAGGPYERPLSEGGGETTTYPWETWRYRYIEALNRSDVVLEFVDPTGSGEYHLTLDPGEKDALKNVPGAGLSLLESMGMANKADRFSRSDLSTAPLGPGGQQQSGSTASDEFERLKLYTDIQRPPDVRFKDLESVVTSRIVRDQVHFTWRADFLKVTSDSVLVPVSIQIPNSQLSYADKQGVHSAALNIFARVTTLTGRVVQTFEDSVTRDFPETLFQRSLKQSSIYQKIVPLRPGLYRLDLVIKDVQSGNIGVVTTRLAVPRFEDDKLTASSLILADQIERVPSKQVGVGQFVLGSSKVRPRMDADFAVNEKLGIYLQVYNLKVDEKTHKPDGAVTYVVKKGDQQVVLSFNETTEQMKLVGEQMTIERLLPLSTLQPGKYTIEVFATDHLANQTISKKADFSVRPATEVKAAVNAAPGR